MRTLFLILSGATILLLISGTAHACQCLVQAPASTEYWRADAVFVGSVTDIVPSFDDLESSLRTKNRKVSFSVETTYRGTIGVRIDLQNWINSCEIRFEKGHKYLIYAYRNSDDNSLDAQGCSRTTEFAQATDDLRYLNALKRGTVHQDISGTIQDPGFRRPHVGISVIATINGRHLKATSDRNGNFKIPVPGPGQYTVKIYFPAGYAIGGPAAYIDKIKNVTTTQTQTIVEYQLTLAKGQCEFLAVPALEP